MNESENIEDTNESGDEVDRLEAARAQRRRDRKARARIQRATDLKAIAVIEDESGVEAKILEPHNRYEEGVPVAVAVRCPTRTEYRRYNAIVRQAKGNAEKIGDAQEQMARACILYPVVKSPAYEALVDKFPGSLNSIAIEVTKLAELEAEEEKKE